jgi:hypothetical protein
MVNITEDFLLKPKHEYFRGPPHLDADLVMPQDLMEKHFGKPQ